ncbi:hypothetical protein NGRA_1968 [Nosema granulosis]|uniref:Uncharacterized protein n=1 Tax=Nosema granulosis TaxID=83296 RepID=A0A9P6H0S5_9MICR|nr:hypothetical protein NGRA_1968 [Nosema granulosis]
MSYTALCYFILGFMILSLVYFGYGIMHKEKSTAMSKASMPNHGEEKKINFVLVINTETGQEARNTKKVPLSTKEIVPQFSEALKLATLSSLKKSNRNNDLKPLEGGVSQNILNTKAIFIPHNQETLKHDWDENSDRFGAGEHRSVLKFNPFFKSQESNMNLPLYGGKKDENSSSSSTSY